MIYLNGKTELDYNANFIHWECSTPEAQAEMVTVPLRDGIINLTNMLSDEVHFGPRQITIGLELRALRAEWAMYYSRIMHDLHGREVKIGRSEDPNYYYIGTASVSALNDHGSTAGITITVQAQPFKRTTDFVEVVDFELSGETEYTIENQFMRGYPVFTASTTGITVSLNGETWTLPQGESEAYGMYFSEGENELTISGSGTLRICWSGGLL